MRNVRGFTLIELMIAGSISAVVALSGFVALNMLQRSAERQASANDVVGRGRMAIEVIARDVRSAGDAMDLLPDYCMGAAGVGHHPLAIDAYKCASILEPHPWRLVIGRNAWRDPAGTGRSRYQADDMPPDVTRAFDQEPENVVLYEFVPEGDAPVTLTDSDGRERTAWLGRIDRVINPFSFERNGAAMDPQRSVLLDRVLLDDRMRVNPANPDEVDSRYDHSLFMYQVLTSNAEFNGDLAERSTTLAGNFLTPPLRFFDPEPPAALLDVPPWMPAHDPAIVGLEPYGDETVYAELLRGGSSGMDPNDENSDLRLILDRNRIRAVRVAFKLVGDERTDVTTGVDLDGDPSTGYAPVYQFETTVEIKTLALFTVP